MRRSSLWKFAVEAVLTTSVVVTAAAGENDGGPLTWDRATGDWGGARTTLEEHGVEFGGGLTVVWQANHRGGIKSHPQGKWTTSWDLEVTLQTEKLRLWPGGTFFVHWEGSEQVGIEERFVGSLFGVNADAASTGERWSQFSEYWYEHTFADGLLTVRIGKMDATADCDTNAFANDECTQFLNGALVNNPTIPFPDYALGAQATLRPDSRFYLTVGAWDANAEGWTSGADTALRGDSQWFVLAEAGIEVNIPTRGGAQLPGTYRVGAWHDPLRYETIGSAEPRKGESGWYLSFDQMVYKESAEEDDTQGLGLFARYGYAPDHYSAVEHFWSVGLHYQGLVPTRDDDVLGFGIAQGKLGRPARSTTPHDNETVYECFYNIAIGLGASLTLDLQYVKHPGATGRSSVVPGLRLQLDF